MWTVCAQDGAVAACRTDFTGRGELADRQQKLGQMLALLKKVSRLAGAAEMPQGPSGRSRVCMEPA